MILRGIEEIRQNEICQIEKDKYCVVLHIGVTRVVKFTKAQSRIIVTRVSEKEEVESWLVYNVGYEISKEGQWG